MQLNKTLIKKIMHEYKDLFEVLESYDKTREWPVGRAHVDITLDKKTIKKLRELRKKTNRPISRIIEEAVENL